MQNSELGFIAEIKSNPDADEPRLVYADWLEERGDPRADYLRAEMEFARMDPGGCFLRTTIEQEQAYEKVVQLFASLERQVKQLDEAWVNKVGIRFDLVVFSWGDFKLMAVKEVKNLTGCSLFDSKNLTESAPSVLVPELSLAIAVRLVPRRYCFARLPDPVFGVQQSGLSPVPPQVRKRIDNLDHLVSDDPILGRREILISDDVVDLCLESPGGDQLQAVRVLRILTRIRLQDALRMARSTPVVVMHDLDTAAQVDVANQLSVLESMDDPPRFSFITRI